MSLVFGEREPGRPFTDPSDPIMDWYRDSPPTTDSKYAGGELLEPVIEDLRLLEEASAEPWPDSVKQNAMLLAKAGFWPGEDFLVIPYVGRPKTAGQNAANAQRYGARGVELSAIAKSFAGLARTESGEESVVVLTGPGDLSFKTTDLVKGQVGELEPLDDERLEALGFEHGTVGPIGALTRDATRPVTYLFDQDFINWDTRNPDNKVYLSGGDPSWSIALDIRKLIARATTAPPTYAVRDICERGPDSERVFARHSITLITGDSSQVGGKYSQLLEEFVRGGLIEANAYFDDSSMPRSESLSEPEMGGSGNLDIHHRELTRYVGELLAGLRQARNGRLVAFTSNAANLPSVTERATTVNPELSGRTDLQLVTVQDRSMEILSH